MLPTPKMRKGRDFTPVFAVGARKKDGSGGNQATTAFRNYLFDQ
jgi:hypothetical protein